MQWGWPSSSGYVGVGGRYVAAEIRGNQASSNGTAGWLGDGGISGGGCRAGHGLSLPIRVSLMHRFSPASSLQDVIQQEFQKQLFNKQPDEGQR